MITAVLDTNVYISALFFGGVPRAVLRAGFSGSYRLVICPDIILELKRVLNRPKFGLTSRFASAIILELEQSVHVVYPEDSVEAEVRDPDDNKIIECAVSSEADYLVTGDKDLLEYIADGLPQIVTPARFADVLDSTPAVKL